MLRERFQEPRRVGAVDHLVVEAQVQAQFGAERDPVADKAAYTVSKSGSGGTIALKAFLRKYKLIPEVTTQFDPEENDDGLVVIDLDDPKKTYGLPDGDEE